MNLRSINHNLLPVLLALLRERNVSRAARSVGLSQPAASKALAQLRAILNDRLLVRAGQELILTRRAEDLFGPLEAICRDLEAIWQAKPFDPATSHREFVIAGSDYCAMMTIPKIAKLLAAQAPFVRLRFTDLSAERMLDGRARIDFLMAPTYIVPERIVAAGCIARLFVDDFVTIVPKGHALDSDACPSASDLAGVRRIAFANVDPFLPGRIREAARFIDGPGRTQAIVQQFVAIPILVLLTDTIATVPRRLAEQVSALLPLRIIEGANEAMSVEMALAWNERHDADAHHRWFREFLVENLRAETHPNVFERSRG